MELIKKMWFAYFVHIADVLVVAYVIYRIMLFVKGTRAVQIIIGLLTLVVITFLARDVLGLATLSWLLEKFWFAAVLILAVAFQPEIRSALAQLGSHRWGRILLPSELGFIEEITKAVEKCSQAELGALLVLEQEIGLKSYLKTGTMINANVSWELLLSIFNPRSPLHDGAAIIQDGVLLAAGCVLPLSDDESLLKFLGTRHRAALGLSEISDAFMVIVSEESGSISLAYKGKLDTNITVDELKDKLEEIYKKRNDKNVLQKVVVK